MGLFNKFINSAGGDDQAVVEHKPFYKRPLFWIIIIICLTPFLLLMSCFGGGGSSDEDSYIPVEYLNLEEDTSKSGVYTLKGLKDEYKSANFDKYNALLIPNNVKTIDSDAFKASNVDESFVKNILSIECQKDSILEEVKSNAFSNLTELNYASFPASLNTFGSSVFENDTNFAILELKTTSVISYSSRLLSGTMFNTSPSDEDDNQGTVDLLTEAIARQYMSASGWSDFPNDVFVWEE